MEIAYLVSALLLCLGFILIKKSDKVLDIISFVGITITVLLAYNAFVCYVINFASISTNLINLSIVNFIFSFIMFGIIIKNREVQKYRLDKFGLLSVIIIFIVVIFVSYLDFGFPFHIKYETGDPAVHYQTSVLFAEEESLLNNYKDEIHGPYEGRKIGSYVNSGIIMECCSSFMDTIEFYKIFIVFGIFILFMTGIVMYSTLEKFTKSKGGKVLALIVSLIYVMGYPLNSLLFGFEYLSLGILVLGTIVHIVYYFENEELKFPFYVIIFALLNFDVFCSYYMFVPFTYSALWIYFCIYSKNHYKKIICKKNVIMLTVTLLIPFLLGFIYHLAPDIYNVFQSRELENSLDFSSNVLNNSFALYGYIYVNYYSNILLFLPFVIYYILSEKKEKREFSFEAIFIIFLLLFIMVLILGEIFGRVSEYFVMKNYYALWLIIMCIMFKVLMNIYYNKDKFKPCIMVGAYVFLIILNLIFIDAPLGKGPGNPHENIANLVEIFGVNKTIIKTGEVDLTKEEINVLRYVKENLNIENDKIEFLVDPEQMFWEYSLIECVNYDEFFEEPNISGQDRLTYKAVKAYEKIGEVDYIVYLNSSTYYKELKDILFEQGEVIFKNSAGGVIKYE